MRSHPPSSRAGETHSAPPEIKSATSASIGTPPPGDQNPGLARRPKIGEHAALRAAPRSSASVVYILPTEQSVPTVSSRRPSAGAPVSNRNVVRKAARVIELCDACARSGSDDLGVRGELLMQARKPR